MGILRFTLAILVLISHTGRTIHGLNPGVMAVVAFYVISGYVMASLIERHYAGQSQTGYFYGDRLLRIYPQYALYAIATAVWYATIGHSTPFLAPAPGLHDALNNLLIVPLNFFMYNGADRFTLIPPAWSLGAELLFYALAPFMWRHWRWALALGTASLGIQILAWHGQLNTDWWGYRLLPGVLWIFLLGMALQRYRQSHPGAQRKAVMALPMLAALITLYLHQSGHLVKPYNREVLLGLALAIPLVHALGQYTPQNPRLRHLDTWLGNCSYGIFLNHFLLIWVLGLESPSTPLQWATLLFSSVILSALTQKWAEQPILALRIQWRQKDKTP